MPASSSRKRSRGPLEDETVGTEATSSRITSTQPRKKRKTGSNAPVEPDGTSSTTLVGDEDIKVNGKRDKGKGRAVTPPLVDTAESEEARIILGQQALLEKLRASFTCAICTNIYDNPVAPPCGHVSCRRCLEQHFRRMLAPESDADEHQPLRITPGPSHATSPPARNLTREERHRNLICPDCRAPVHEPPQPIYTFRDAADAMRRAEMEGLLPKEMLRDRSKSPTANHSGAPNLDKRAKQTADTTWGGLFPEGTNQETNRRKDLLNRGINDREDGVFRCWRCNWEIEDGMCNHCGEVYDEELYGSDDSSHFSNILVPQNVFDNAADFTDDAYSDEVLEDLAHHTAARRSHRVDVESSALDLSGDVYSEEEEGSEDRRFIVDSGNEYSSEELPEEPWSGEEDADLEALDEAIERKRKKRPLRIVESDEDGAEESDDVVAMPRASTSRVLIVSDDNDDDDEQASAASAHALTDDNEEEVEEEEESDDTRRRRKKRERQQRRRQKRRRKRRAAAAAEPRDDDCDSPVSAEEAPPSTLPSRRRREIVETSKEPSRRRRVIHVEDDED